MAAAKSNNDSAGCLGCGLLIVVFVVIGTLYSGVSAVVHAVSGDSAPKSVAMPAFRGQDCETAQSTLNRLTKNRVKHQVEALSGYGCGDNVVLRTSPSVGTRVVLDDDVPVEVEWRVIDRKSYAWYIAHRTMPSLIGRNLSPGNGSPGVLSKVDATFVNEVGDDSLIQIRSDGSSYIGAGHKVVRTVPKAGARLRMGQTMEIYTQTQRGKFLPATSSSSGGGSGGSSVGGGGGHHHFGACVHFSIFHACT